MSDAILSHAFLYEEAPFPSCHASTIVETKRGMLAAFFGGTHERHPDVCIYTCRLIDGKWQAPVMVADGVQADGSRFPTWNPVLFQPRNGPIMLFYKVGPNPREWWGMVKTSNDEGVTWSDAVRLPDGILGPIKNKPIQLNNGDIVSPTSVEGNEIGWKVYFERSSDGGKTWTATPHVQQPADVRAIQPSILIHSQKKLQALGRTKSRKMFEVWSEDGGQSWKPMRLIDLPNCNSGTDAVTLRDGSHLLIYNHSATEKIRYPLNLAMTKDGVKWNACLTIESEPPGQYSYPAIIQSSDGLVHAVYTWKRLRIRHVVIDPEKLTCTSIIGDAWPG
jgi:predicted neuraminidase